MKKLISIILILTIMVSSVGAAANPPQNKFDISDALNILLHLAGMVPLSAEQMILYDVDGDPGITINDALEILMYLAGMDNKIGKPTEPLKTAPPLVITTPPQTAPPSDAALNELAAEVVRLVNAERAKEGLAPLSANNTALNNAAMQKAQEIIISFTHARPDGRNWDTILSDFNVVNRGAAENIAWGQSSPANVMTSWMNSEGHRRNIMRDNYTHIGVGVARNSEGRLFWAQIFIRQ
jgi:uncharacterized protein YkwD